MRVLFLSHYDESHAGGIELVVSHLAREFSGLGVEVAWAATSGDAPGKASGGSIRRIPMHSFNVVERVTGLPYPVWSPWSLPRLVREVGHADIVHVHDAIYFGSQFAGWFARRHGKPIVTTQHVGFIPYPSRVLRLLQHGSYRLLTRPFLRRASAIAFVSDRVRQELANDVAGVEARTIYNGVDLELFHPTVLSRPELRARLGLDPSRPVFLFVGRFNMKKGLVHVRRAAQELTRVQWVFVGWGNENPAAWGLSNVIVAGRKPPEDLVQWYNAADLLVLPSVGEGFPLVVQEAMACGTPCLVSDETRDGCVPARSLIHTAGPKAAGFLEACRERSGGPDVLESDRARIAAFAAAAWSWKTCARAYLDLYAQVLPVLPNDLTAVKASRSSRGMARSGVRPRKTSPPQSGR